MLLDANLLLSAVDEDSPQHAVARVWVESVFGGTRRVAVPWQTIGAVLRISTHPKIMTNPLGADQAWDLMESWLAARVTWIPLAGARTAIILGELAKTHRVSGNLFPDAQLAALALEHGLTVCSADSDFARFREVRWINPLA